MTRAECIQNAARSFATGRDLMNAMTPRRAAEAAHYAGGPSVDEIERHIISARRMARAA